MSQPAALVLQHVQDLIREGKQVIATQWAVEYSFSKEWFVEVGAFGAWTGGCSTLHHMLGPTNPWSGTLADLEMKSNALGFCERLLGTLKAVERAVQRGHIVRVEDLARAEVLGDLLEQADHLHSQSYFLAAGVLCRAALEEHLRVWCARLSCSPQKSKPTLNDYLQALYGGKHLDLIAMKHVESMAAVGNACAHNKGPSAPDVERLLRDTRSFMVEHGVPAPPVGP